MEPRTNIKFMVMLGLKNDEMLSEKCIEIIPQRNKQVQIDNSF